MKKRMSMLTGFAAGYYAGARAGRERYDQINGWVRKMRGSEPVQTASEAARSIAQEGVERATETVERHTTDGQGQAAQRPNGGRTGTPTSATPSMASPAVRAVGE